MIVAAKETGHMKYHEFMLKGWSSSASYTAKKALYGTILQKSGSKSYKRNRLKFLGSLNSEADARAWGCRLDARIKEANTRLQYAGRAIMTFAGKYSDWILKLSVNLNAMLPHANELIKIHKKISELDKKYSYNKYRATYTAKIDEEYSEIQKTRIIAQTRLATATGLPQTNDRG